MSHRGRKPFGVGCQLALRTRRRRVSSNTITAPVTDRRRTRAAPRVAVVAARALVTLSAAAATVPAAMVWSSRSIRVRTAPSAVAAADATAVLAGVPRRASAAPAAISTRGTRIACGTPGAKPRSCIWFARVASGRETELHVPCNARKIPTKRFTGCAQSCCAQPNTRICCLPARVGGPALQVARRRRRSLGQQKPPTDVASTPNDMIREKLLSERTGWSGALPRRRHSWTNTRLSARRATSVGTAEGWASLTMVRL